MLPTARAWSADRSSRSAARTSSRANLTGTGVAHPPLCPTRANCGRCCASSAPGP
jgi:hypothetical protein